VVSVGWKLTAAKAAKRCTGYELTKVHAVRRLHNML